MKKTVPQAAAAEEGEKRAPSTGSDKKKQLSQRLETEETSAAAGARIGASATTERFVGVQAAQEESRLERDGDKHGITTTMKEVTRDAACLHGNFDGPEELYGTSFSRKSTAAFTSRGNSCRFLGSVTAGAIMGASGDEEATEERLQQVLKCIANADGPEVVTRALTIDQQQTYKDTSVASGQNRSPEKVADGGWKKNAPADNSGNAGQFFGEPDVVRTSEQYIHDETTNPVRDLLREQHNDDSKLSSKVHKATTPRSVHNHSSLSSCFTALQAPSFDKEGSSTQRAALLQGVCESNTGKEYTVESCDFQLETKGGEATVENEAEGKTAFLADIWQFKRSASDGPSANLGMWRSDEDLRGIRSTEPESTREDTARDPQQHLKVGYEKDCAGSSRPARVDALDHAGEQNWDSVQHPAPHWDASFRQPREICETPKRGDLNIIRSLSSLTRGVSAARERRGKFEGEGNGGRRTVTGGCLYRGTALRNEPPAQGRKQGTTQGQPPLTCAVHERSSRQASSTATERLFQHLSPGKPGKGDVSVTSNWSHLTNEDGEKSKDSVQRSGVCTQVVPRRRELDDPQHAAKPARTLVSSLSFPLDQHSCRKAAHGKQTDNREFREISGGNLEKANETRFWRDVGQTSASRNCNNNDELWDAIEVASPILFAGSTGNEGEATNIVLRWTGAADVVRQEGHATTRAEGGVRTEREEARVLWKRGAAAEETDGERLVRELVEEFDKRRTNFSILVPKVLELVSVLMGQPAGTPLPSVLPRNFCPAACILRPAPLPICATFSEVGQTSTIENLERCFPCFSIEGGLLLCTQGRRLESGGGGKYYFQDSRGHVVGCHKKHLARYDAQGRVASPVLLKTLLFCLVLKPVSRSKHARPEPIEEEAFTLPASVASENAAVCRTLALPALRKSCSSCDSGTTLVSEEQEAGDGEAAEEVPAWAASTSPLGSPRLLRSLLDPLPPADALLAEVQSSAQKESVSTGTCPELGEQPNEMGSTSTRTSSSSGPTTLLEELETPTMKKKAAGAEGRGEKGGLSSQGSKLTRRSESCLGILQKTRQVEESHDPSSSGRLRRAVSSSVSAFADKQSSAEQPHRGGSARIPAPTLGGSPTSKRETELWECLSEELRTSARENKHLRDLLMEKNMTVDVEQRPASGLARPRKQTDGSALTESANEENRLQLRGETGLCPEDDGDGSKSGGTASPALSSAASPGSLTSSVMQQSPWWGNGERNSAKLANSGMLSVVRSSNPQRLVRVYRSLVVEDKTHVVERLLRVWSMTLHVRTPQNLPPDEVILRSSSSSCREKATAKTFLMRKNVDATVGTRRQRGLIEETGKKRLSVGKGTTGGQHEEGGATLTENVERTEKDGEDDNPRTRCRQGGQGSIMGTGDGTTTKPVYLQDGEQRTGTQAPETFLLRKANTTECGRFLRSGRAAEKSVEALIMERDERGRQNPYEDPEDSAGRRRLPRLRRASTSARRDLSLERQLPRCRGGNERVQEHFNRNTNSVRLASPCNHGFKQQPTMCKKRNDAGQGAVSSHLELGSERMGQTEVFQWRPCMSILWVKPLTVEQTMLKWSKSTPLYEPVEELEGERGDTSLQALAMRYGDSSPVESPLLSVALRSGQSTDELFLTPTSTPKGCNADRQEGKKTGLLSSCSPDSVRSELSTSADCTSSLPPSPLFARASAMVSLSQMDQQPNLLQQAVMLPRLQPSPLPALEQSPTSLELLQAIQQHLLQLIQRGEADQRKAGRNALNPGPQKPPKEGNSSTGGTDVGSDATKSHNTEVAPAQRVETLDAPPRHSNTWTAPEFRGPSNGIGDDSVDSPMPSDFPPHKGVCIGPLLQMGEGAGDGPDISRAPMSELYQSSVDSAEVSLIPPRAARETGDFLQSMMPPISGSGLCPFVGVDLTNQSPRSRRILEHISASRGGQVLEQSNVASDEENSGESASFDELIPSTLRVRSDVGQLQLLFESSIGDQLRAAMPAGGGREHESGVRLEGDLAETEICSGAVQQAGVSRAAPLQRSAGQHPRCSGSPLLEQTPFVDTTVPETDPVLTSGTRGGLSFQTSGPVEGELDSVSLISRLLGLSVGDHSDEGAPAPEDQTVPLDHGTDHARRCGQSSRKRGLDTEEVHKEEERGPEGRKKVAAVPGSSPAIASTAERTREDGTGSVQQDCNTKKASPKKKTKWSASSPDEISPEDSETAKEARDNENPSETPVHGTSRRSTVPTGGLDEDASRNNEERRLTWNAALEQRDVRQGLVDLFAQVLQQNASATEDTPKGRNE